MKRLMLSLFLLLLLTGHARGTEMTLQGNLQPGSATLLRLHGFPPGAKMKGALDGVAFPISAQGIALVSLDMTAKPGKKTLVATITPKKGPKETLRQTLTIPKRDYKVERITLPERKVDLNKPDLTRANKETATIKSTYKKGDGDPTFAEGFRMPVTGRLSGVFGSQRILNGKPRSPHSGLDVAAPAGTPVLAMAPGEVLLTGRDYFFTGNTVVLYHGQGVTSLYSHMQEITVKEGEQVEKGAVIGKVGMTGRATGPHLHFSVRVRNHRVDPLLLPGIAEGTGGKH